MNRLTFEMKKLSSSTLILGIALSTTWAGVQVARETSITTGRFSDGVTEIKILGVCELKNEKLSCWNFEGKSDEKLSNDVDRDARNFTLPFRYQRQNRFIVRAVSTPSSRYVNWTTGGYNQGPGWANPLTLSTQSSYNDDLNISRTVELVPYSPGIGEDVLDLSAFIRIPSNENAVLVPKEGQSFKIGKAQFKLSKIEKSTNSSARNWILTFETSLEGEPFRTLSLSGLDEKDVSYMGSDANGNPIRQSSEGRQNPTGTRGSQKIAQYGTPYGSGTIYGTKTRIVVTGDPSKVHHFSASAESSKSIKFTSIPLNPN